MTTQMTTRAPERVREIGGVAWRYFVGGIEDGPALLILPGFLGGGEMSPRLEPFLDGYRILTLAYPPVSDLKTLMRGIDEIVTVEGLGRVDLLGGSFGGMVAQGYVRHRPEGVRRLILQGTAAPKPDRASSNERFLKIARFIPMAVFRSLLRLIIRLSLRKMDREERRPWIAYYRGEIGALTRADVVCRYRLAIDFDRHYHFGPRDLVGHSLPILILAGEDDRIAKGEERDQLKALYPEAHVHTFSGVGHGMSLLRPEEWGRAIRDFLKD